MPRNRCVLVIEPVFTGHHRTYFENTVAALVRSGHEVIAVVPEDAPDYSSMRDVHFQAIPTRRLMHAFAPKSLVHRELRLWLLFRSIYRGVQARFELLHVVVPYLD